MKFRNMPFYLFIIGFFLFFTGCVSAFIISLRRDQAEVYGRIDDVNSTFEEFSTNVSLFEDHRDILYGEVLSNLYYDSMLGNDTIVKERLSNYESMVDSINKKVKSLDKLCADVYFPDQSVNNKCNNYKLIYEQVNNYFVSDIAFYNSAVEKYNEFVGATENPTLAIKKYQTKKKYVDYNNDEKYDGRDS